MDTAYNAAGRALRKRTGRCLLVLEQKQIIEKHQLLTMVCCYTKSVACIIGLKQRHWLCNLYLCTFFFGLISQSSCASLKYRGMVGISRLAPLYDVFLVDQWGVLHDGKTCYDGAIDCLLQLKSQKKILIMLSNSSKRKSSSEKGLTKVGITPNVFDGIITSGELGHSFMTSSSFEKSFLSKQTLSKAEKQCFVIGNGDDDIEYVQSAGWSVAGPEEAQFVLARGTFSITYGIEEDKTFRYTQPEELVAAVAAGDWLTRCAALALPMLVTNPDFHRPGSNAPMPGQIGALYEKLGGRVRYIGKPYADVYEACKAIARDVASNNHNNNDNNNIDPPLRYCGVGDSLEHDIAGAKNFEIDQVWIANGVHAQEMDRAEGDSSLADNRVLAEMYRKYGIDAPTHAVARFAW